MNLVLVGLEKNLNIVVGLYKKLKANNKIDIINEIKI